MNQERVRWGLLALLVLGAIVYNLRELRLVEEEVEVGASGPARRNPWYAVELLLQARGVPAESAESLADLPPTDHVILWMTRQPSAEGLDRLEAWVRAGGHLIAVLPSGTARRARQARLEDEPVDTAAAEPDAEPDDEASVSAVDLEDALLTLTGALVLSVGAEAGSEVALVPPQGGPALTLGDLPWVRLASPYTPPIWPQGDAAALPSPAVRVALDQGWITLLVSGKPFNNSAIGDHDHGALIWALAQRDGPPAGALLIVSDEPPSIWALLATYAWPVLVSAAVLMALWLWATLPRFGPLLPDPSPHRRSLNEHVVASGALLWRLGHGQVLLRSARRAVLRDAVGIGEDTAQQHGLPLYDGGSDDPERFVAAAAALDALRRSGTPTS